MSCSHATGTARVCMFCMLLGSAMCIESSWILRDIEYMSGRLSAGEVL